MGLRFLLAYVILISAWVALLLVVGTRVEKEDPEPIALGSNSPGIDSAIPEGE